VKRSTVRRAVAACSIALVASAGVAVAAQPASAEPVIPVKAKIKAKAHIEKMNQDIEGLKSKFKGTLDLGTGELKGSITLPPSTVAFPSNDLNISEIQVEVGKTNVNGHVNLAASTVKTKSKFDIHITSVTVLGLPPNLVGDACKTETPIKLKQKGQFSATESRKFKGTFEIPPFENCQLFTPVINNLVPGPDNTFTSKFKPIP
jgi:hypothetical protein